MLSFLCNACLHAFYVTINWSALIVSSRTPNPYWKISINLWTRLSYINSLAPGRFQFKIRKVIFKLTLVNCGWCISSEIALRWMPPDLTDNKSTLVQVMALCHQATSHYLSQCWTRFMLPVKTIDYCLHGIRADLSLHVYNKTPCLKISKNMQSSATSIFTSD